MNHSARDTFFADKVKGHTDSDGTAALNGTLSKDRALAVKQAFVARGIPSERLDVEGFSYNRPVASNSSADGKRMNRRVEIIVLDETVAAITAGENPSAFEQAWGELKSLIDRGLVKAPESTKP